MPITYVSVLTEHYSITTRHEQVGRSFREESCALGGIAAAVP